MASGGSEIREHGDINESKGTHLGRMIEQGIELQSINNSRGTHLERVADDHGINIADQPDANYNGRNGQVGIGLESQPPWFIAYTAFMAIQVGILALHFQGSSSSPFKTHPAKMWTFVFAMFINLGAALYYGKSRITCSERSQICDLAGYISGSLASVAFLSILVPHSLVPLVFVIWMLHLPIYFNAARDWILKCLRNIWNRDRGSNNVEQAPLPPPQQTS